MTLDTSGRTSYAPFASWDHDSSCWKTCGITSLWDLPMSSVILPAWGGLHDGDLYELPTPEPRTIAPDYSLLRTPTAQLGTNGGSQHPDKRKAGGHGPTLADEVEHLLPTPKATNNENRQSLDRYGPNLGMVIQSLGEPTGPLSHDGSKSRDGLPPVLPGLDALALPA